MPVAAALNLLGGPGGLDTNRCVLGNTDAYAVPVSPEVVYLVVGLGLLLATILPTVVEGRAFSAPMLVLAVGVAAGLLIPGEDPISPILDAEVTAHLAEVCVIISLMGVGLSIERPLSWRGWRPTWRLLFVAMPLCIAAVAFLGWWGLGLSVPAAILLGAVLAPTDPVLASEVQVSGPGGQGEPGEAVEPEGDERGADSGDEVETQEDETRFALTAEAGLNDAFAFPFVYLALFLMSKGAIEDWVTEWVLWTLVGKILVGVLVGWLLGRLLAAMAFRSRVDSLRVAERGNPLLALAATFAVYGVTELVGGYGFVAVFAAALAIRAEDKDHAYHRDLHELIDRLETILTLVILLILGAALSSGLLLELDLPSVLLAVALVFVIRPVAGWVSLLGEDQLTRPERAAVSALGVRGIGSVYYLAYAMASDDIAEGVELWGVVSFTIVLSVVVHGVAATPVMGWLDARRHSQGRARTH